MINKQTFPCSSCGSTNTVMESQASYMQKQNTPNSLKEKIKSTILATAESIQSKKNIGGSYVVKCKDCGNVSFMMIN